MLSDINEEELEKIGSVEGVNHLSQGMFRDPAFSVSGIIHGPNSRFMIPLSFQRYGNHEHVNILGVDSLRKMKLNLDINWDQDTFKLIRK
ncbi:unnamed protein product [Caenorhabditis sp. 36 PRJEB53466]|nr:unnamed protein product [Caenorhabditis sp. 36 PRJEB53466]